MSASRVILPPKRSATAIFPIFDFQGFLNPFLTSDVLSSVVSVTVIVWTGVDANPSAVYAGTSNLTPPSVVQPELIGGIPGVIYLVKVIAGASGSRTFELDGLLAILPAGAP